MEGIKELVSETLNPWLAKNSIITSIDWVKPMYEGTGNSRKNVNKNFEQLISVNKPWDLIIIDEAHYVSTEANRSDLARALQDKCYGMLLLTATPHSGNPEHFFNLLNILEPFMFQEADDLNKPDARERIEKIMIRRGKETIFKLEDSKLIKKFKDRVPHPIEIEFSKEEKELYDLVSEYTSENWTKLSRKRKISASDRNIGKFILTLVQKRMVSSLYALKETLGRRIESIIETRTLNKFESLNKKAVKSLLKTYEQEEYIEDEDKEFVENYLETRNLQGVYAERTNEVKTLRELLEKCEKLISEGKDSKLTWLKDFLKKIFNNNPAEKVIIFTEYRDTLNYIKNSLENKFLSHEIVVIHGGMPLGENEDEPGSKLYAEKRFNDPDTRVLLATDAASEGLNLQKYCHIMVNYELPWNPNRLEQRIGRIHRYGQKYNAQIYNLMIKESKEAEIFKRLQDKIEIIRKQLGNMAEVLGILEKISIDDLILTVLNKNLDNEKAREATEKELKKMEAIAEKISKTQFLSGCKQFSEQEIINSHQVIAESQKAIPDYKDIKTFVELFLNVYGKNERNREDGTILHKTNDKEVYKLIVPPVIQDDKLPKIYSRITFKRDISNKDWDRKNEPEFIAFGHPLLERMVYFCREKNFFELSSKISCIVADYNGGPGIIFNFILKFEDNHGKSIREELETVFVDIYENVNYELGKDLVFKDSQAQNNINQETISLIRKKSERLKQIAESFIRNKYQEYYERVAIKRNQEIDILLSDLNKFDRGIKERFEMQLREVSPDQLTLFDDPISKGKKTRIENQQKMHELKIMERKTEIENMKLSGFPAPELLNMVLVTNL